MILTNIIEDALMINIGMDGNAVRGHSFFYIKCFFI